MDGSVEITEKGRAGFGRDEAGVGDQGDGKGSSGEETRYAPPILFFPSPSLSWVLGKRGIDATPVFLVVFRLCGSFSCPCPFPGTYPTCLSSGHSRRLARSLARPPEKLEDARAKAAIRAQIEADKQKRAEKAARDKAIREGQPVVDSASASGPSAAAAARAPAQGVKGSEYKETRLQVRLSTGGAPLVKAFPSDARESPLFPLFEHELMGCESGSAVGGGGMDRVGELEL